MAQFVNTNRGGKTVHFEGHIDLYQDIKRDGEKWLPILEIVTRNV
jgi:hypothetical protein